MIKQSIVTVCIVLSTFSSTFSFAQSETIVECELANTAEREGKLDEALVRLKNCLSNNPKYSPALLLRANIFVQKKQYRAATNIYSSLIENNVNYALFSEEWGNALWQQKQFESIIQFADYNRLPIEQKDNWLLLRSRACIAVNNATCAEASLELISATPNNKLDVLLSIVQIRIQQKNYSLARESLDKAIAYSPNNQGVEYLYGKLALEEKDARSAINYFLKLLEKDPTNTLVLRGLTDAYLMDELTVKASETIESILALQPGDPFALATREIVLSQLNETRTPDPAFEVMRNAVAELPNNAVKNNPQLTYLRGLLSFRDGQYESALTDFNTLYQQDKSDLQTVIFLAKTRLSLGKDQEAIRLLENYKEELFDTPDVLLLLAEQYMKHNQTFKVVPLLEKLVVKYPNSPKVSLIQVKYLVTRNQLDEALTLLYKLVDQYPQSADVNRVAAIYGIQMQNYELAQRTLDTLKTNHNNVVTRELSASLSLKRGNITQAKAQFLELQALIPNSLTTNYNLAIIDLVEKNNGAAIRKLNKNLAINPSHSASLYMLGLIKLDQNQMQDGRSFLQEAAVASNNAPYTLKALIRLENNQGEYNTSLNYANQLVEAEPFNIDYLLLRADVLLKRKDPLKVDTEIQRVLAMNGLTDKQYGQLSNLYLQIGKAKEAASLLVDVGNKTSEDGFLVRAVEILLNTNETAQAKETIAQISLAQRQQPRVQFLTGRLFEQEGKVNNAKQLYIELIKVDPYSNILMGKLYQYSSDIQVKSAMLDALHQRISENSNDYFAQNLLAQVYFYDGDLKKSQSQYKKLLAFKGQESKAGILHRLSIISDRLNDPESTLKFAKQAYELDSQNPTIMTQFGWSLTRFDDPNAGLKILRQAVSADNNNDLLRYYTAETLYKLALYKESYAEIQTISNAESSQIQSLTLKLKEKLQGSN